MVRIIVLWIFLFSLISFIRVQAHKLQVGEQYPIKTIKEAIQIANPNDTVQVYSGHYREGNIVVDKSLTLLGIGMPVLDGDHTYEILSVKSPYVVISGFRVQASGHAAMADPAGIKIYNTHHVTIKNNVLEDNFFGIYAQQATQCTISNNILRAYSTQEQLIGNGIHAWKSSELNIQNNRIQGHRDGIYLEFVTHTHIEQNFSRKNLRYGLHFMFSHNNSYMNNTFSNNGAGVAVMYTRHVTMMNNVFKDNWGDASYGLLLKEITDSRIEGNTFLNNTTGILMEGTTRIKVQKNKFLDNGWAVKIQASCMDNVLERNDFRRNTFDVGTNGSLVLNTLRQNYWDKYEGYDLNKDGIGDVPYRPVSLYAMIAERYPVTMILFRSFMVSLLDRTEKMLPSLTPENMKDDEPALKPLNDDRN